jgi:hypothetical protein
MRRSYTSFTILLWSTYSISWGCFIKLKRTVSLYTPGSSCRIAIAKFIFAVFSCVFSVIFWKHANVKRYVFQILESADFSYPLEISQYIIHLYIDGKVEYTKIFKLKYQIQIFNISVDVTTKRTDFIEWFAFQEGCFKAAPVEYPHFKCVICRP